MSTEPPRPDTTEAPLDYGRACHARRAWADAYEALDEADHREPLAPEDLVRLAEAALLTGRDQEMLRLSERVHQAYCEAGRFASAARSAFWAAFRLLSLREHGQGNAWLARAQRNVERHGTECAECGYLLLPVSMRHAGSGDFAASNEAAQRALAIGERYNEADVIACARNLLGRNLVRMGRVAEGLCLMDEAMLSATSGELSPTMTGVIYCSLISGCQQVFAVERALEWTAALERWRQSQPQIVAFTSSCLVHRSEVLQLNGAWQAAIDEAQRASTPALRAIEPIAAADAQFQQGEIHRLRGERDLAEQAYRTAHQLGREPQPGLALLRLAQGRADTAAQSLRRVLSATTAPLARARYLPAFCEIMLGAGALEDARAGCAELEDIAQRFSTEFLGAMAAHARGALHLAEDNAPAALEPLRSAMLEYQRIPAPYIVARLRVLIARACLALGDHDTAALELDAARSVFAQLGAADDLANIPAAAAPAPAPTPTPTPTMDTIVGTPSLAAPTESQTTAQASPPPSHHNLSPRELEVLRLVATGKTNRVIARALSLSEKTVDRHVSNILAKLDVESRAAATAYAYQHRLL